MNKKIIVKIFPDSPDGENLEVAEGSTYEELLETLGINQELVILLNDGNAVPLDDVVVEGTISILKAISGG